MAEYDVGEAFIRLVPSFRGVAESIDREAAKWGASAGAAYRRAFEDEAKRGTPPVPGPSDEESRRKGAQAGRRFGEGFKAETRAQSASINVKVVTGPALTGIAQIRRALLGLSAAAAVTPLIGAAGALVGPALGVGLGAAGIAAVVKNAQTKVSAAEKLRQQAQASSPAQRQALQNRAASLQAQAARAETAAQAKGASAATKQRASQLQQQAAAAQKAAQGPTAAQQKANAAMAGLTPQEQAFAKAQETLKTSFTSWASSLERYVLPVVTRAMRLIGPLLDEIRPLVITVSRAVGQVLSQARQGMKSAGLDEFVFTLNSLAGPAIRTVATVLGNIGSAAGTAITKLAPMAGAVESLLTTLTGRLAESAHNSGFGQFVKTITGTLPTLTKALGDVGGLVGRVLGAVAPLAKPLLSVVDQLALSLGSLVKGIGPALAALFNALAPALNTFVRALGPLLTQLIAQLAPIIGQLVRALLPALLPLLKAVGGALPTVADSFLQIVKALLPLIPLLAAMVSAIAPILRFLSPLFKFAPIILGIVAAVKAWAVVQQVLNLVLAANPIVLVVAALAALAAGLYLAWEHSKTFQRIVKDALNAVKDVALAVVHWFSGPFVRFFTDTIPGVFKAMGRFVVRIWNDVWGAVKGAWDATAGFFVDRWKSFTGTVAHAWHAITGTVSGAWRGMVNGLKAAWRDVARWLGSAWNGFVGTARNIWGRIVGGIKSAFGSVEGFFKNLWYRVERIFAGAVNFITQDILNPIIRVLDDVLHVFGVNIKPIGRMVVSAPPNPANAGKSYGSGTGHGTGGGRTFAFGGVEPGYAPGRDTRTVRVSPGEGMVVPEVVRMLGGPPFIDALNALSPRVRGAGGPRGGGSGFSLGGVLGRISHDIGSFAAAWRNADRKALLGIVHGVRNVSASAAYHALRVAESPILRVLGHLAKGSFVDVLAHGVFNKLDSAIRDFIRGNAGSAIFAGTGVGGAGALAIWKNLRAVGMSPAQAAGVMGNMISESGLNPFIIQGGGTSMNPAAAGGGGYGLVQWTPGAKLIPYLGGRGPSIISEVQALAAQLSGRGPSPEGGAGAALRGARTPEQAADIFGLQYERYAGPPQAARSAQARQVYDRYSKYDSGGFLPPGLTAAFNGTGRPELVLTADQQKALSNRGKAVEFNTVINPAAHQSEAEIAAITANMMSFRLRSSGAGF